MKAKIAKQEGDCRSSKKVNEMLEKQVKMLEKALKYERAKNKSLANGENPPQPPSEEEVKEGWNGKIGMKPSCTTSLIMESPRLLLSTCADHLLASLPGVEVPKEADQSAENERDTQRDKSKAFLQKCLEELTYLLTPPTHPLPPQPNHQSQGSSFEPQDIPMHDAYVQQQQQQPPRRRNPQLSHLPSLPNHPPPPRSAPEYYQPTQHVPQPDAMPQHLPSQSHDPVPRASDEVQGQPPLPTRHVEEPVEQVTHAFDSYGRQIPSNDLNDSRPLISAEANGWDFDDGNTLLDPNPPDSSAPHHPRLEQTDQFPNVNNLPAKSPPRAGHGSHRRKSSGSVGHVVRKHSSGSSHDLGRAHEPANFRVKFALRGHVDVVRSVIFTGGGSPSEPEVCTTGDDGTIKRWIVPAYSNPNNQSQSAQVSQSTDTDIQSYFTHRGHEGLVTSLAACPSANSPASPSFSTGGRALGDGWIFSGGQDTTVRVWERGRVDPKATLDGHTDAVWALAVLPAKASSVLGGSEPSTGNPSLSATSHPVLPPSSRDDRILLASGAADGSIKIWACSAPPTMHSPQSTTTGGRRGSRRLSVTSGSNFPSSPQPSTASGTLFHYQLIHNIDGLSASPTSIASLGAGGESFVVAFADAQCVVFDTRTGESVVGMQSQETYDGTPATGINAVVVAGQSQGGFSGEGGEGNDGKEGEEVHGATGSQKDGGVEGVVITGHEDRFVRFFDANSGTFLNSLIYGMLRLIFDRPMHLQHAGASCIHCFAVALAGRQGIADGRP